MKEISWFKKITRWWEGEVGLYDNRPGDSLIFISLHMKRHWTSNLVHAIWDFYIHHWQWLWGTVIAIVIAIISLR